MKNLLLLSFLCSFLSVTSQSLQWSVLTDSVPTLSSPRAADLNSDGVLDIVLGAGTDSTYSNYGIMAFDGLNGNNLWTLPATDEIFGSAVFNDVNSDNIPDVFIGGRNAQFYAIDGSSGNVIWEAFPQGTGLNPVDSGLYNFYSGQVIPDQNGDLINDILVANGGDHNANPWDPRPPGHLMVLDGANGNVLAKAVMPDSNETYCSPIVADLKNNGILYVIFGTGGEHHGGSVWVAELANGLMNNDLTGSLALATHNATGFIAPVSVGDFTGSGYLDIIVQSFDGTIYRFDGSNFSQKWMVNIPNTESSAAPVIGNFHGGDLLPDVFAVTYKGTAPTYFDFYQIMINGTTGNVEWIDSIGDMHYASANAFDANDDGRDEVLVSLNNYVGHFEHELVLIDFQNDQTTSYFQSSGGANIASTPYVGDLNNDNKLEIIYTYRADSLNPGAWNGFYTNKIFTPLRIPLSGIAWGGYMGTNYDGHYHYTSTDCGTASVIGSLNITQPSCNGFSDGIISVNALNGTPPYTYLWSDGSVNDSLTGVPAGTYKVIVSDAAGCYEIQSAILNDPYVISFGGIQHNTCAGDSIGMATLSSSGCPCMFSTCSYLWENGDSTKNASGLSAGYWSVEITHMDGCVVLDSVEILDGTPVIDSSVVVHQQCYNLNAGSIQLFPNDTIFTAYDWSTGDNGSSISNLSPGQYSVLADNLNCFDSLYFTIEPADTIDVTVNHTNVLCNGDSDGTITTNVSGGTPGYSYVLNGVTYLGNSFNSLDTGNYSIHVLDSLGCNSDTVYVQITEPEPLTVSFNVTPATDTGSLDGTAYAVVQGGVPPYDYVWDHFPTNNDPFVVYLPYGFFPVTINDVNGCQIIDSAFVDLLTNVDQFFENHLELYPNPSSGKIFINTPFSDVNYSIYSIDGRMLINTRKLTSSNPLNLNLNKGTYLIKFTHENSSFFKQIIIH